MPIRHYHVYQCTRCGGRQTRDSKTTPPSCNHCNPYGTEKDSRLGFLWIAERATTKEVHEVGVEGVDCHTVKGNLQAHRPPH